MRKNKYLYGIAIFLFSCTITTRQDNPVIVPDTTTQIVAPPCKPDTIERIVYRDSIRIDKGQKKTVDSLKKKLFVAQYKIERVRYYLHIVNQSDAARAKYSKFLNSWISRAVAN